MPLTWHKLAFISATAAQSLAQVNGADIFPASQVCFGAMHGAMLSPESLAGNIQATYFNEAWAAVIALTAARPYPSYAVSI